MTIYKNLLKFKLNEESYKEFFKKALKEFGIKSPKELKSKEDKKKFFDYIEKNWTKE